MTKPCGRRGLGVKKADCFMDKILSCLPLKALQDGFPNKCTIFTIMQLQPPLVLAQLPRPLGAEGRTLFNSVYGVSQSGKIKRHEIVAAVDGEAVNVYDVQSPRLITSYSVPPQSSFPCSPCSIRMRSDGKAHPVRHTYCVLQRPEVQLQCFTNKDEEHGTSKVTKSVFSLDGTESPVIFLETIPGYYTVGREFLCDVVIVHQDGTVRRIAGDLSIQRWSMKISDTPKTSTSGLTVRTAYWMSEEQAKKTLLKQRLDLLLDQTHRGSGVLALIAKRSAASGKEAQEMIYGLWSLQEQRILSVFSGTTASGTTPLVIHTLPSTEQWRNNDTAQYSFNSVNGALSISFSRGLVTYDLSTYTPEMISKLSLDITANSYPMRLTTSLAISSTSSAVILHDTKHQSIQSTVDMEQISSGRKRKRSKAANQYLIQFIAYFAKVKRLVACWGNALIAFDITSNGTLSGNSNLIDAVGHGTRSGNSQHMETSNSARLVGTPSRCNHYNKSSWSSQQQRLDELAEKGDILAFDELMAKELCESSDGNLFEHGPLRLPRSSFHIRRAKIDYLISKIFEPLSDVDVNIDESANFGNSLKVVLQTRSLIQWLILARQLTDRNVERSLQRTRSSHNFTVRPGAVVLALIRDQSLYHMITDELKHTSYLPMYELLQAVEILLEEVVAVATRRQPAMFLEEWGTDHEMSLSDTMPLVPGDDTRSMQMCGLSLKAPFEDTMTSSLSSVALLVALQLLGSHPSRDIATELRSKFTQSQILSIIQVLRQQLFNSGHTSYLPTPPSSVQLSPKCGDTHAEGVSLTLDSMLKLLSSCLDAIGPVGFLAQSTNDEFLDQLIPDLKSEVSFAFEGMQETNHLQGLLREVIRYADSMQVGRHGDVARSSFRQGPHEGLQKPGTIVTLYNEPRVDQGDVEARGGLLPLSLRVDNAISETKVRKGGGQVSKRSMRDILKLQDRHVGQYSFERLVL